MLSAIGRVLDGLIDPSAATRVDSFVEALAALPPTLLVLDDADGVCEPAVDLIRTAHGATAISLHVERLARAVPEQIRWAES